eukprot:g2108.t1
MVTPAPTPPTPIPNPNHLPLWELELEAKRHAEEAAAQRPKTKSPKDLNRMVRLNDMNYKSGSTTNIREGDYVILHPPVSKDDVGPLMLNEVGVVDLVDFNMEKDSVSGKVKPYYVKAPNGRKWWYKQGEIELAPLVLIRKQKLHAALSADDLRGLMGTPYPTPAPNTPAPTPAQRGVAAPTVPPTTCKMSDWGAWSDACTKPCGGGIRFRTRKIIRNPIGDTVPCPPATQVKPCNTSRCPGYCLEAPDGTDAMTWSSTWTVCSRSCGTGLQHRGATLNFIDPEVTSKCPTLQHRLCNETPCPVPHPTPQPSPSPTPLFHVEVVVHNEHGQAAAPTSFKYLGCFMDHANARDLVVSKDGEHGNLYMNPSMCSRLCKGFMYFGLQHSYQCYCGNTYGRYGKDTPKLCDAPCGGKSRYHCGSVASESYDGQSANSIFRQNYPSAWIPAQFKPTPPPTPRARAPLLSQSTHMVNGKKVVRDVHNKLCPSILQPKYGKFRTQPGRQGCCMVDKAMAAIEIIQNIRTCKRFYNKRDPIFTRKREEDDGSSSWQLTFNHGWLDSGVAPACSRSEAETLLKDVQNCCKLCCKQLCMRKTAAVVAVLKRLATAMNRCENAEDNSTPDLLVAVGTASCAEAEQLAVTVVRELLSASRLLYGLGDPDVTTNAKKILQLCHDRESKKTLDVIENQERNKLRREAGAAMIDLLDPIPSDTRANAAVTIGSGGTCLPSLLTYIRHALPTADKLHGLRELNHGNNPFDD